MTVALHLTDYPTARHACEQWHYAGTMPAGPLDAFAAIEADDLVGAIVYSVGTGGAPHHGSKVGAPPAEVCELSRVAFRDHVEPITAYVAASLRVMALTRRLVVSYADPAQGHLGRIYQAGNWTYVGTTDASTQLFFRGRWRHSKSIQDNLNVKWSARGMHGAYRQALAAMPRRLTPGKFIYLMGLDKRTRRALTPYALPYPTYDDLAAEVSKVPDAGVPPRRAGFDPRVPL